MDKLKLSPHHRRILAIVLAGFAGLMLLDVCFQVYRHLQWRSFIPQALAAVTTQPASTQPADTQPASTQPGAGPDRRTPPKPHEVNADVRKRNIFTQPKAEGHGLRLTGVIGKTALFNESIAIEEGKSANNVTVKSINGYEVVIEYKGKPETMKLFGDEMKGFAAGPPGPPPQPMPGGPGMAPPPMPEVRLAPPQGMPPGAHRMSREEIMERVKMLREQRTRGAVKQE